MRFLFLSTPPPFLHYEKIYNPKKVNEKLISDQNKKLILIKNKTNIGFNN